MHTLMAITMPAQGVGNAVSLVLGESEHALKVGQMIGGICDRALPTDRLVRRLQASGR